MFDTLTYGVGVTEFINNEITLFFYKEWIELGADTIFVTNYHAVRIDQDGNFVWTNNEKPSFATHKSNKYYFTFGNFSHNQWVTAFADNRNDPYNDYASGIYAQNITIDGYIGPLALDEYRPGNRMFLNVYPNPVVNNTTIGYTISEYSKVQLSLVNLHGQLIESISEGMKQPGSYTYTFDCNNLEQGIYFIRCVSGDIAAYKKIIVIR